MKTRETIQILEQQLDEAPHSPQLWEDLGDMYIQAEQVDKAIEAYEFALALEPERESAKCKKHIAYLATQDPQKQQAGKAFLQKYCVEHPEDDELQNIVDHFELLDNVKIETSLSQEIQELEKDIPFEGELDWELIRDPQATTTDYDPIIDALWVHQHFSTLHEVINVLIHLHPEDANLFMMYGRLLMCRHEYDQARRYFEKALLKADDDPQRDYYLGIFGYEFHIRQFYLEAFDYYCQIRTDEERCEQLPYMARCCLELDYKPLYGYFIGQLDPANNGDDYRNIIRAFHDCLPMNLSNTEVKEFLLKLFDRYNP